MEINFKYEIDDYVLFKQNINIKNEYEVFYVETVWISGKIKNRRIFESAANKVFPSGIVLSYDIKIDGFDMLIIRQVYEENIKEKVDRPTIFFAR